MIEKKRICDVCGKEISAFADRYKLKRSWFTLFSERIDVKDMCNDCYFDFIKFVNQKRSNNNAE